MNRLCDRFDNDRSHQLEHCFFSVPHCRPRWPLHGPLAVRGFKKSGSSIRLSPLIIPTTRRFLPYFRMGFSGTIGVAFKPWAGIFMIKSQLVLKVADRFLHIRNRAVERAVNVVLDEIVTAMARKDRVELRGFGAFCSKDRAGHCPKSRNWC